MKIKKKYLDLYRNRPIISALLMTIQNDISTVDSLSALESLGIHIYPKGLVKELFTTNDKED